MTMFIAPWIDHAVLSVHSRVHRRARQDIFKEEQGVAKVAHDPSKRHWGTVVKILPYRRGTREISITSRKASM